MGNLLKFEFRKLKRKKSFYICTAIMVGLLLLTAMLLSALQSLSAAFNEDGLSIAVLEEENLTLDFLVGASSNASFLTVAAIFVVLFVCEDYGQQTVKNILARGYSKTAVYGSKLVAVFFAATAMFLAVEIAALVIGLAFFGVGEGSGMRLLAVLASQYVAAMANVTLAFFLATLIRKIGGAIAVVILAPSIVSLVLSIADSYLASEKFSLTDFWLSSFSSDLADLAVGTERMATCVIASLIYIAVFSAVGSLFHKRIEV